MAQLLLQRACAKLRSAIADEALVRLDFTRDLREMLDALEVIQTNLEQVDMMLLLRQTHLLHSEQVEMSVAYMIMDMVDELQDARPPAVATMTRMLPRLAIKKNAMATKKNAMATKVQNMEKRLIQLKEYHKTSMEARSNAQEQQQLLINGRLTGPSLPSFEEASVFGRGADKQRMVAVLLSAASNITQGPPSCIILSIFGLPGSGKTTLAQMVFNDDAHSLQEYNFRVWVHVSPELDFHGICKSICQVVSGEAEKEEINDHITNSDVGGMERIMKRLHEILNGKKVLLVLDDLWEEDPIQLQLLTSMVTFLSNKVHVIVTTHNQATARKICTGEPYRLNPLDDDTCWEIIKKSIGRLEEDDEELEKIGRQIATKCWGLPLAALEYASWLKDSRDPIEWENIKKRNVSNISTAFLKTFILSYMSMSPELRLCLGYCCDTFPNGHNIVKYDLVHQWIALDFIQPSERLSATETAEGYITRLLDMSFFQTAKSHKASGNDGAAIFTIHDVAREFSSQMWQDYIEVASCKVVIDYREEVHDDNYVRAQRCVGCSKVEFDDGSFSSKRFLRVLELKESTVPKLPAFIWQLKYLGYLKISEFSGLVTLPDSFRHLMHVFHIDLSGCSGLVNLPESFGKLNRLVHVNLSGCSGLVNLPGSFVKLVNLVHINLSGCTGLGSLPESFGDLMNLTHLNLSRCHALTEIQEQLQKLSKLVHLDLSFWSCSEGIGKSLCSLTNLEQLNLSHPCCHLPQQRSHLQGLKEGLCKLTKLRYLNLSMCLNPIFYYQSQEASLKYIGDCLGGLSSLEHLDLSHNTFLFDLPQSLGDLDKLHKLDLSGCIRLKNVPEMKSLKFTALKNCRGLESCHFVVRVDDYAYYSSSNISQLEDVNCQELQISGLEKVRSKDEAQRVKLMEKHKLEKLKLSWTSDSIRSVVDTALLDDGVLLGELVPPPSLQCLEVNGYDGTCLPEYLRNLTSLQELKIVRCKQLKSLPDSIQKLTNLKDLCIFDCPELEKWCQLEENKKMLGHIPNKNYEEHGSTSRQEIEEDCRSINVVEAP